MPKLKIDEGDWIVVCDGAKALVLQNVGDSKFPNLKTIEVHEHEDLKSRELGTDAAGRAFASVGSARGSMEETDWHEQAERSFLEELVGRLDKALLAGKTKSLVVVAPPKALGIMRRVYSSHIRDALRAEIDKDYVKLPIDQIERHLAA
jgi:protein required for attachment to host cells